MPRRILPIIALTLFAVAFPRLRAEPLVDGASTVVLNGVSHWYRVAGAAWGKTPLVIVHGGPGGNDYVFEHTTGPLLEKFATVVYYDQRGGGRSEAPVDPTAYDMALLVSDLDKLRVHLGCAKVSLLGFSFGAELALEYAVAHPDCVDRLILQAPNAGDYFRMAVTETYAFRSLLRGDAKLAVEKIAAHPVESPGRRFKELWTLADPDLVVRFQYHNPEAAVLAKKWEAASGFTNTGLMAKVMFSDERHRARPLMDDAAELQIPALVIAGAYDRTTGVDVARDLASAMPRAEFIVLGASAHYPDIEEPVAYVAAVKTFLAAQDFGRATKREPDSPVQPAASGQGSGPDFRAELLQKGRFEYSITEQERNTGRAKITIEADPQTGRIVFSATITGTYAQRWNATISPAFAPVSSELRRGPDYSGEPSFQLRYEDHRVKGFAWIRAASGNRAKSNIDLPLPEDVVDQRIDWAAVMAANLAGGGRGEFKVYDPGTSVSQVRMESEGTERITVPCGTFDCSRIKYRVEKSKGDEIYELWVSRGERRMMVRELFPDGSSSDLEAFERD